MHAAGAGEEFACSSKETVCGWYVALAESMHGVECMCVSDVSYVKPMRAFTSEIGIGLVGYAENCWRSVCWECGSVETCEFWVEKMLDAFWRCRSGIFYFHELS